jgi:hypothetical protein
VGGYRVPLFRERSQNALVNNLAFTIYMGNFGMKFRKGIVLVACLGLLVACSSSQSDSVKPVTESSDLTREEAEEKWARSLGSFWANLRRETDDGNPENFAFWLPQDTVSKILVDNRYYSGLRLGSTIAHYSRNFCGESSYDQLIAENTGTFEPGARRAFSFGFSTMPPDGKSENFGADAMYVTLSTAVFRLGDDINWNEVGPNLFRVMQDQIALQASGRCQFTMRQFPKADAKWSESTRYVEGWLTERDWECSSPPCIGVSKHKFETELSEYKYRSDSSESFYLGQTNLTGRPYMRFVIFVPRPELQSLLLLEFASIRQGYQDKKMSVELGEKHAMTAAQLLSKWESQTSLYSNQTDMRELYRQSQPLSEVAMEMIEEAEYQCSYDANSCVMP